MARVLVVYASKTGNTKKMSELVEKSLTDSGADVVRKEVGSVDVEELLEYDGIVMGTPCYYGLMSAEIKKLLDDSVRLHGKLDGKVGAAFCSSANVGGGNETAIVALLEAMLIHGMVIQGDPRGDHYGAVAIGSPDKRSSKQCRDMGRRVGELVKKLHG
jgi:NAD(P)H dehydrogenase (quinone)